MKIQMACEQLIHTLAALDLEGPAGCDGYRYIQLDSVARHARHYYWIMSLDAPDDG